jgi:hypothetical protein
MTEDKVGPVRMSSRREVYAQLRDAAGNERGLNIDASGRITITRANDAPPFGSASGTLDGTSTSSDLAVTCSGYGTATIEVDTGMTTVTCAIELNYDGTAAGGGSSNAWLSTPAAEATGTNFAATFSTAAQRRFVVPLRGAKQVRVRVSVAGTGSASARIWLNEQVSVVQIAGIQTGSGASQLGKAEDAVHASADVGIFTLGVRNDTYQTRASADGDYNAPGSNAGGAALVANAGSQITSYSAAISEFALAATPSNIFNINGSATKTIRVTRIRVQLFETTQTSRLVKLIKLSTALTGGTAVPMTLVPHDSANATATATANNWTANSTGGGTVVGSIDEETIASNPVGAGTAAAVSHDGPLEYNHHWSDLIAQPIVLRGTAQGLVINLAGAALDAGRKASVYVEWVEDAS